MILTPYGWLLLVCFPFLLASSCNSSAKEKPASQIPAGDVRVKLQDVAEGFRRITDIQFVTTDAMYLLVVEQEGAIRWENLASEKRGTLLEADVKSGGELGLLGLAFHPKFKENGRLYINRTVEGGAAALSRIEEWRLPGANFANAPATLAKLLIEVDQPYSNHNAGQLQFGPDGFLYIGFGDGGSGGDPEERAQNPKTMLGKMLRIDVDRTSGGKNYAVPADNPFVGQAGTLPEIWALGLRNPWRYSFDPAGRLVVADVGQNKWEEVSIVEKGKNYGWDVMEGTHCFEPPADCSPERFVPPIYEYGHEVGFSITGGYVYLGKNIPALKDKYIFGDLNGSVWALTLPASATGKAKDVKTIAEISFMPTTFGRDPEGEVYVADYQGGIVYKLAP